MEFVQSYGACYKILGFNRITNFSSKLKSPCDRSVVLWSKATVAIHQSTIHRVVARVAQLTGVGRVRAPMHAS
jgi:hypothetical protein